MNDVTAILKPTPLSRMTDAELLRAIRVRMKATIESIEELATIVREAKRRNLPLHEFSSGMFSYILAVADHQLDAELLYKFADESVLLRSIKGVPLETQKRLARGEKIPVVEFDHAGQLVATEKTLRQMTGPQARLVFADGRVVPVAEQKRRHKELAESARAHVSPGSVDPAKKIQVRADAVTGDLIVGPLRVSVQAFLIPLRSLGWTLTKIDN